MIEESDEESMIFDMIRKEHEFILTLFEEIPGLVLHLLPEIENELNVRRCY